MILDKTRLTYSKTLINHARRLSRSLLWSFSQGRSARSVVQSSPLANCPLVPNVNDVDDVGDVDADVDVDVDVDVNLMSTSKAMWTLSTQGDHSDLHV